MAKKNLNNIHSLITAICESVKNQNSYIEKHLNRVKEGLSPQNHQYINKFQDKICKDLKFSSSQYNWGIEETANGRKENDSIDILGENNNECCIIEIDATRIDQVAQKFLSRLAVWGLETKKPLLYVAILYKGSATHRRIEDCEKYIRYCNDILKACKGKDSSVVGIYTDGNIINVIDYDIASSFKIKFPNGDTIIPDSMPDCALQAIKYYINNNNVNNFVQLEKVFGKAVSNTKIASKDRNIVTKFGDVYVCKDWREYGKRAYWNEFVNRSRKVNILIEKQTIEYQTGPVPFKYV